MKCRVLTLAHKAQWELACWLSVLIHTPPFLSSFSPAFSIPHTSHSLALSLGTRPLYCLQLFSLQVLTVLALTSFRLLPETHVFRHHPYSPFILLCLRSSYPYMLFINSCSLVGCWSWSLERLNSMGAKNFCLLLYSQHLEQSLAYKINVENSWNFLVVQQLRFLTGNVGASRFNSWSRNAICHN